VVWMIVEELVIRRTNDDDLFSGVLVDFGLTACAAGVDLVAVAAVGGVVAVDLAVSIPG